MNKKSLTERAIEILNEKFRTSNPYSISYLSYKGYQKRIHKLYLRRVRKNGCEFIKCPDYKNGRCHNELDYVDKNSGEQMCPYNVNALPRKEYIEEA